MCLITAHNNPYIQANAKATRLRRAPTRPQHPDHRLASQVNKYQWHDGVTAEDTILTDAGAANSPLLVEPVKVVGQVGDDPGSGGTEWMT
jgi:hypothetical protein